MFNGVTHNNYESGYGSSNSQCVLVYFMLVLCVKSVFFWGGNITKNKISSQPRDPFHKNRKRKQFYY